MKRLRLIAFTFLLVFCCADGSAQEGFSDKTRALYILDISRYVRFDESFQQEDEFTIAVLDRDDRFYWELEGMARTRKVVQGKPIRIFLYPKIDMLEPTNVVFVNSEDGYDMDKVLDKVSGNNTLLISEGYPFRTSMINFVVVGGKPRFEVNEELMNREGLYVNELFLALAVKTREDWEALYEVTEDELELEKSITEQQHILIGKQLDEISRQEAMIEKNREILEKLRSEIGDREAEIRQKSAVLAQQEKKIREQQRTIEEQVTQVKEQHSILAAQELEIKNKAETITLREDQIRQQDEQIILQAEAIQKQKIIILATIIALALLFGLVYFIWVNYRNKKRANVLLKAQRDQIAYQKKHITDSIEYARRIQTAILPSLELFSDKIEHFVLFKPRDIVSGDFYWAEMVNNKHVIITADCTGHGVPGAFMSMLGVTLLNEIILTERMIRPDQILNTLRDKVIDALKQEAGSDVKDGMDMTVCVIDYERDMVQFSGANNPLYHLRQGELTQVKGDKMPVAIHEVMDDFSLHELDLRKGDTLYTFSDGYADQFGGPNHKKFLVRNFRNLILSIQDLSMIEQGTRLDETFENYRKDVEQVDDVVVIGLRY